MKALYAKRFLCGSVERNIPLGEDTAPGDNVNGQKLAVKTSSFARSSVFGSNEQWCYTDLFQRKIERDGFVISQQSLPHFEFTPGRMIGAQDRVDQLHDLAASYLADLDPGNKGLRVVFNAKFRARDSDESCCSSPTQTRRLLTIARGVTKIPELVRCRRFGFQLIPGQVNAISCCFSHFSSEFNTVKDRYETMLPVWIPRLCRLLEFREDGEHGRVASIVVCRRRQVCIDACNYADISTDRKHGPARVVDDPSESTTASLLVDFLADSLEHSTVGSSERSNVFAVVRALLQNDQESETEDCSQEERYASEALTRVDRFLREKDNYPLLEDCTLANADKRDYVLDLPDNPSLRFHEGRYRATKAVVFQLLKTQACFFLRTN
ncbi:hypothetical protein PI124_g1539 [Phytophthora idaei]|nr:hypothetical protein PI125_g1251 [Phytophthora idaei]KAG3253884.1 hypothetical protein PI124_g1539 [Phytophthora idaei]